jgi:X-X-X-Leu-X-X-Gly heptad repeat protein
VNYIVTEENSEGASDKIKEGLKKLAGGSAKVVEGTAQGVKKVVEKTKEGVEETADEVKENAKEATDTDTYTESDDQPESRDYNQAGGKEPMNPEDIASHEPTAVSRDQDTGITGEGQSGTDSVEAKEKFRKKGMTET